MVLAAITETLKTSPKANPEKTANELFSMGEPRFLQDSKAHDYQKTDNHITQKNSHHFAHKKTSCPHIIMRTRG